MLSKRTLIQGLGAALAVPALGGAKAATDALKELRVGYQKSGVLLIAKAQASLDRRFAASGTSVKWVEFSFGPPLLEALNAGAIDYGAVGDSPPIFAQAARANLVYVAVQAGRGQSQGVIVPPGSPIRALTDLKGRKVGIAKASSAHSLTIAALESVGLRFADIQAEYLAPSDAAAAFARGSIDAWTIWDPYLALAELNRNARRVPIADAAAVQNSFFLANRDFTTKHPETVSAINTELGKANDWAKSNTDAAAALFAEASGVELAAQKLTVSRTDFSFAPMTEKVIAEQQAVADRFFRVGLIPKQINVRDIVWQWNTEA